MLKDVKGARAEHQEEEESFQVLLCGWHTQEAGPRQGPAWNVEERKARGGGGTPSGQRVVQWDVRPQNNTVPDWM